MSSTSLSDKQIRFCDLYLIYFNATKAAEEAGYSKKTAKAQGSRLLTNVDIRSYLQNKKEKTAQKLEITRERTMLEIARVAFSDLRKMFGIDGELKSIADLDDDAAACLAGVEILEETASDPDADEVVRVGQVKKIKVFDKTKALEMLAKHFKIYSDAPQVKNYNLTSLSAADLKQLHALKKKLGHG